MCIGGIHATISKPFIYDQFNSIVGFKIFIKLWRTHAMNFTFTTPRVNVCNLLRTREEEIVKQNYFRKDDTYKPFITLRNYRLVINS